MSSKYILKIISDKNKLSDRALEVAPEERKKEIIHIIKQLEDTIKANKQLIALSAPQIGINKRIFCIRFSNNVIKSFINPIITHSEGIHLSREVGVLSSKIEYIIPRIDSITAMYQNREGNIEENKFEGAPSEIFQQMFQLLDGVLVEDYGLEILPGFDDSSEEDKKEIIEMYMTSLNDLDSNLKEEINNNPDLKISKDAIDFMTSVALGKTEVVPEESGELKFEKSTLKELEDEEKEEKFRAEKFKKKIEELKASNK